MTVYNSKQVDALVLIRDGMTMTLDGVNLFLESQEPKKPQKTTEDQFQYNLEKIIWTEEIGPNGKYQKAIEQDNEDFRALINDLEAHDGKVQRKGFFLWKFNTIENTVGRKKQSSR